MKTIEEIKEAVKALAVKEATIKDGDFQEWERWFAANERMASLANAAFHGGWKWLKEEADYAKIYYIARRQYLSGWTLELAVNKDGEIYSVGNDAIRAVARMRELPNSAIEISNADGEIIDWITAD